MKLLSDTELVGLLTPTDGTAIVHGVTLPHDPYGRTSPVQPSSLDLTIGSIYVPDAPNGRPGSLSKAAQEHVLKPGQTAIVVTAEEFNFPSNIAAFGFPPTRISSNGILMTNPGHIDPGFKGYVSFTVINMSRKNFILRKKDPIVTCLLIQLACAVCKDYETRGYSRIGNVPHRETYDRLSPDFLNFEERSRGIAKIAARKQVTRWDRQSFVAMALTLLLGVVAVYFTSIQPISDIKADLSVLKSQQTLSDLGSELEQLQVEMQLIRERLEAEDEEAPADG